MAKKDTRTAVGTLAEIAEIYDVSADTVKRWRAEGMPGKPQNYILQDVTRWLRTDGPWRPHQKPVAAAGSDDPMLADGQSEALERYRLAKAKHAELDLENRKGELIEREKARDVFSRWAVVIRRMGESLAKRYGSDASATVNDALAECRSVVSEVLG